MLPTHDKPDLDSTEILSELTAFDRSRIASELECVAVRRGEQLIKKGEPATTLYIVVTGRFAIHTDLASEPIAEISSGQPIGEISFLTGEPRTAHVIALRDGTVLKLEKIAFDRLLDQNPALCRTLAQTLASRLAAATASAPPREKPTPETIAIIPAGQGPVPHGFAEDFFSVIKRFKSAALVGSSHFSSSLRNATASDPGGKMPPLSKLEQEHDVVVLVADNETTAWSECAIRNADMVIAVARFAENPAPNPMELIAADLLKSADRRLVLVHQRKERIVGTKKWLSPRSGITHHHICPDEPDTLERLVRFIEGRALGFVACGGGALAAAHIGLYKAFADNAITFDILGGTSAGAAMLAAFAIETPPATLSDAVHDIFVTNRAMHRYNWPRYGLLDHGHFDRQLSKYYLDYNIEDLWIPFFAVSTNLSRHERHVHSTGRVVDAVRASSSIPVLLPPVYTKDGEMLVDGCLLDNVPIEIMHRLKRGPNVVASFHPEEIERFNIDYDDLPTGTELIRKSINPLERRHLPEAPSLISVLMRAMMANRYDFHKHLKPDDSLFIPPIPKHASFLDWHLHNQLSEAAYTWTKSEIEKRATLPGWLHDALHPGEH